MGNICCGYSEISRLLQLDLEQVELRSFKGKTRLARVKSVYDGDTFTIVTRLNDNEPYAAYKLRPLGFDAPELKPKLTIPNRKLHVEAGHAVANLVRREIDNQIIEISFQKEEKYGRLCGKIQMLQIDWICGVALITRKGDLGEWLIEQRMVLPYEGKTKDDFDCAMLENIVRRCKQKSD